MFRIDQIEDNFFKLPFLQKKTRTCGQRNVLPARFLLLPDLFDEPGRFGFKRRRRKFQVQEEIKVEEQEILLERIQSNCFLHYAYFYSA